MTPTPAQATTPTVPSFETQAPRHRWRATAAWVIVGGFAFALFARTLDFGLYLDDHHHARPWTAKEVLGTFHGVFDPLGIEPVYFRPLPVVTFAADWNLWGYDRWGYHLTNILLHMGVCLVLYAVLRRTTLPMWGAVVGAVFFAAIPANAATAVYISERSDAMVALFTLAGLLCVHRYRTTKEWAWLVALAAFFLLSVGSKEVGFAMLLLVIVWWAFLNYIEQPAPEANDGVSLSLGQHWLDEARAVWRSIVGPGRLREWLVVVGPLVVLGGAYLLYRRLVLPTGGTPYGSGGPIRGLASGIFSTLKGVPWEVSAIGFPVLAVAVVFAFVLQPRDPGWRVVTFGATWIVAACIPLAPLGSIEPRLLYVAEIGLAIIVAGVAVILARAIVAAGTRDRRRRWVAVAGSVVITVAAVAATGVTTIRAQDQFEPGSAKMLNGDLIVWEDVAKRHLYEQRYLDEIEADLREAGLID